MLSRRRAKCRLRCVRRRRTPVPWKQLLLNEADLRCRGVQWSLHHRHRAVKCRHFLRPLLNIPSDLRSRAQLVTPRSIKQWRQRGGGCAAQTSVSCLTDSNKL
ncbi:hypothetical protein JOB18_030797 [Solea senegalensis]|uniref:Uncharacterized protein n=1 Tax=Solea senegalensis TaxID=28829 RepID=A0AAV6QHE8_SOLSE|nr:hypothetical protein JOB18_030797 [Solea senegalensis]